MSLQNQDGRSEGSPLNARLLTMGALLLPLAAGALVLRVLPANDATRPRPSLPTPQSADRDDEAMLLSAPRVPAFPTGGPNPPGKVTMADVRFTPMERMSATPFPYAVNARFAGGLLKLSDAKTKKTFWVGPIANASFVKETTAAVHTIKNTEGQVLWSNAAERANPDLRIERMSPGQAELRGKNGTLLWAGALPQMSQSTRLGGGPNGTREIAIGGLILTGKKGDFTITNDAKNVLWSGCLPEEPSIVMRDGNNYSYVGKSEGEGGEDQVSTIVFESEPGQVTIEDTKGRIIGKRTFDLLKYREQFRHDGSVPQPRHIRRFRHTTRTEEVQLLVNGTALITYQDSRGRIYQRGKIYKSKDGSGSAIIG